MKHAGPLTLDRLENLLAALRSLAGLKERTRGVFYLRSRSFLHFHEDPTGIHADLRVDGDFVRFRSETKAEQRALLTQVRRTAGAAPPSTRDSEKTKAGS